MSFPRRLPVVVSGVAVGALVGATLLLAWSPLSVKDDPLVRMPGSQPAPEGSVTVEAPNRCFNCHGGYNQAVEPGFNWQGSMMAQAARDFLFFSCLTVAAQDSIWAVGRPNATDICIRCHSPKGWLEGRSDPTNASALTAADWDGVQCDFCHLMYDPFFETTADGTREGSDWLGYWDETDASDTPSSAAAQETYLEDATLAQGELLFNGDGFFVNNLPQSGSYTEATTGQYFVSTGSDKRASFADAAARHRMLYSRFHKSKYFCSTCHDVSNPILANLVLGGVSTAESRADFGSGETLWTEDNPGYAYYHVERTFSEFMLSDYGQPGGAAGIGPFTPDQFETSNANNYIARCQDCHMRDVVGEACNKKGVPVRPDQSVEHPESGQPLHDLTGGNVWVSYVLATTQPDCTSNGQSCYDSFNDQALNQGPAVLTLDLSQGLGIDAAAMVAGVDRARQQLQLAASIQNLSYDAATGALSFRIQNQTGHKLISGFPEGRRMFINIKAYAGGSLVYEVNPYDTGAGTLKGLPYPYQPDPNGQLPLPQSVGADEAYVDVLVYEIHPSSTLTEEQETFHFALATGRYKDNRIPPKGFRIDEAVARQVQPVWHGAENENYFTATEYAGGYDDVSLTIATGADTVEVNLYYQTTSREYIEFLRDEIEGTGNLTLDSPTPSGEPSAYVIQTDPWFDQLRSWGGTIWDLWTHNMNLDGAAPFLMTQATIGGGGGCTAPTPALVSAVPGQQQVTIGWNDEHSGDPTVVGYNVYYDQAAKGQFIDQVGLTTTYDDTGLTNGQEYCYKVTSRTADCESEFSNILCATPHTVGAAGVTTLQTGYYSGKGKNRAFVPATTFAPGDTVVLRALVKDDGGTAVSNAQVTLAIAGPENTSVVSNPSDADGWAEASWSTQAPNKKGQGGTPPGSYAAEVVDVVVSGYTWDGVRTAANFVLE